MYAEKVFRGGTVYTADAHRTMASAVAIAGGKFVYVGTDAGAEAFIGPDTQVEELGGRLLMPTFFEGHAHFTKATSTVVGINLAGYQGEAEYVEACRRYIQAHPGIKALRGQGYLEATFPGAGPRRQAMDAASADIPIVLQAETLHSVWANTAAIRMAGITRDTPDPENGRIERGPDGEPSGCFRESAQNLMLDALPDFSVEEYEQGILSYQDMAHKFGFSGAYDPWLYAGSNAVEALKSLDRKGKLTMRLRGAYWADPHRGPEQVEALAAARDRDNIGGNLFHINAVKFFMDGVLESVTAFLLQPYQKAVGRPAGWRGDQIWDPDNMNRVVAAVDKAGMGIHVHCAGDAAVKQTLNAIEYAEKTNGKRDARHCITHIFLIDPADIRRFTDLDVVAMTNSYWFQIDDTYVVNGSYTGEDRIAHTYPEQCLFGAGLKVANASDYPVTAEPNPFVGIELGVTRIPPDNYHPWVSDYDDPMFHKPLWPEERASVRDMLDSFTVNQAYANFLERETGSIEVGKSADLIVSDRNILTAAPEDIGTARVLKTLFMGKTVYEA
jgi:predicted amidohydrolase YtcJ